MCALITNQGKKPQTNNHLLYDLLDLARLPGLLCLGSAELVLPCSLPCFALPMLPTSLIRESTKGGGRRRRPPPFVEVAEGHLPYEACWRPRQGKARQTARQDQLSRAKAKQARQPSQILKGQGPHRAHGPYGPWALWPHGAHGVKKRISWLVLT